MKFITIASGGTAMTLQQLKCFSAVAKHRSFARAAEELYISQPAVTHHIRTLEEELHIKLVLRDRHHVTLTPAGDRFLLEVTDILRQLEYAVNIMQGTTSFPEVLHIGFENTVEMFKLPEIFRAYKKLHPFVRIYCHGVGLDEATKMFNTRKLDILFSTAHTLGGNDETFDLLFQGHFCCVVPKGHELAGKKIVHPEDLDGRTLIFVDKKCCAPDMYSMQREMHLRFPGIQVHFSTSANYTAAMIRGGYGLAVMPD